MANGRTVTHTNIYSNTPYNHTITDVTYDDFTTETFGPTSGYIPNPGDIEDLDASLSFRIGWHTQNGYITGGTYGSAVTFTLPQAGTYQVKYGQTFIGASTPEPKPTIMDILEFWEKMAEDFYLVEVKEENIKEIGDYAEGLLNYMKYKKLYGKEKVTITKLTKEAAKILFGKNEIKD